MKTVLVVALKAVHYEICHNTMDCVSLLVDTVKDDVPNEADKSSIVTKETTLAEQKTDVTDTTEKQEVEPKNVSSEVKSEEKINKPETEDKQEVCFSLFRIHDQPLRSSIKQNKFRIGLSFYKHKI